MAYEQTTCAAHPVYRANCLFCVQVERDKLLKVAEQQSRLLWSVFTEYGCRGETFGTDVDPGCTCRNGLMHDRWVQVIALLKKEDKNDEQL